MNNDFPRIKRLPPYVFNITNEKKMAARHRGEDIIDLSMGNPDGDTPKHIVDKLVEVALRPGTHGYSASKGIPRLRKAICDWYKRKFDVDLDPDKEAIVTIGSKEGIAHLMLATLDRGDTILVPNPSYPIHIYGAIIAGADVRSVKMAPGTDFFAEFEKAVIETTPKPKLMILGFPSNPTAQCVDISFFERLVALAKKYGVYIVHDLAYADIVYDDYKAPSIMQVPGARDVAVEFFTMSKSYNMAGWRIGFMVGNKELVSALTRIKSYHDYGTFTPIQVGAIEALNGPQDCVEEVRKEYDQTIHYIRTRDENRERLYTDEQKEKIAPYLKDYMSENEEGILTLFVPCVVVVKDGQVVDGHVGTVEGHDAHERKMTAEEQEQLKKKYEDMLSGSASH